MYLLYYAPLRAMTLDRGFMMAASAEIFWRVTVLPAVMSTMAIWPDSHPVMYLSDSMAHEPNLMNSPGHEVGGVASCVRRRRTEEETEERGRGGGRSSSS